MSVLLWFKLSKANEVCVLIARFNAVYLTFSSYKVCQHPQLIIITITACRGRGERNVAKCRNCLNVNEK